MNIRILISDDHTLFRSGIVSLLKDAPGIYIVGEAENGLELVKKYETLLPDVILADISMPKLNGFEAVKKLISQFGNIKALFLTMHVGDEYIYQSLLSGGLGLVNKAIEKGELIFAINEVFKGRTYFGPLYNEEKIIEIRKKFQYTNLSMNLDSIGNLTETEEKILTYISDGLNSQEIADLMFLSKKSIDGYRTKFAKQFNLNSQAALIRFALKYVESKFK